MSHRLYQAFIHTIQHPPAANNLRIDTGRELEDRQKPLQPQEENHNNQH